MLENLISASPSESLQLAECVHYKTMGNAYYVKQYLLSLYRQGLLAFNFGSMRWMWDTERIRARGHATDNVVGLLTSKLGNLPAAIRDVLPQVAGLGSRFTARSFGIVVRRYCDMEAATTAVSDHRSANTRPGRPRSANEAPTATTTTSERNSGDSIEEAPPVEDSLLDLLEEEGLIVKRRGSYVWEHDKVQESALALSDKDNLDSLLFEVGEVLLREYTPEELSMGLFVVTNLLNRLADPYPQGDALHQSKRTEIAELNLQAGRRAYVSAAFSSAVDYLARGIKLLPPGEAKWTSGHRDMALQLHANYAETCFCVAMHEETRRVCDDVLALTGLTLIEKRRFYNVRIHSLGRQNQTSQAMEETLDVLSQLGCRFPKRGRALHAAAGLVLFLSSFKKTVARIENLPPVNDERTEWTFYLLDRLATYSFQHGPDLLPLVFIKALRYTLRYGISAMAGPILSFVGMMLSGSLGDPHGGRVYADLALKHMTRSTKARTHFLCYYFILPFTVPSDRCKKPLLEGYEAGMKSGDLESAFWCVCVFLEIQLFTTGRLIEVLEDFETYCRQMEVYQQEKILANTRFMWQAAVNLRTGAPDGHILKGDVMDEATYIGRIQGREEHAHEWHHLMRFKALAGFWSDQHREVVDIIASEDYHNYSLERHLPGNYGNVPLYALLGLSCVAVARDCSGQRHKRREAKRYIAWAGRFLSRIQDWVGKGNCNCQHTEFLLRAELDSVRDNPIGAKNEYDVAILLAGRWGLRGDHGLAHELRGDFAHRGGDEEDARYHYTLALALYDEWGALGKCDRIRGKIVGAGGGAGPRRVSGGMDPVPHIPVEEVEIQNDAATSVMDDSASASNLDLSNANTPKSISPAASSINKGSFADDGSSSFDVNTVPP